MLKFEINSCEPSKSNDVYTFRVCTGVCVKNETILHKKWELQTIIFKV